MAPPARSARVEARPGLPTRLAPSAQQHDGPHHARPHGSLPLQAVPRRVQQRDDGVLRPIRRAPLATGRLTSQCSRSWLALARLGG